MEMVNDVWSFVKLNWIWFSIGGGVLVVVILGSLGIRRMRKGKSKLKIENKRKKKKEKAEKRLHKLKKKIERKK